LFTMKLVPFASAILAVAQSCVPTYHPGPQNCSCGVQIKKQRIIGGTPAMEAEFPWIVALIYPLTGLPFCGGSILSSTTILTAAHCIPAGFQSITVAIPNGDPTLETAIKIETTNWQIHPNYGGRKYYNDFAVLTLPTPVRFSEAILPICLPNPNEMFENTDAIAHGWGITSTPRDAARLSDTLLTVNTTTMSNEKCSSILSSYPFLSISHIPYNMICAGESTCGGDSGGPLIALSRDGSHFSQIGVTSWSLEHCLNFTVYARVTAQIYWIMGQVTGETCAPPMEH